MTDIVERLRQMEKCDGATIIGPWNEAANEIEQLRKREWIVAEWATSTFYGPFASQAEAIDWLQSWHHHVTQQDESDDTEVTVVRLASPDVN